MGFMHVVFYGLSWELPCCKQQLNETTHILGNRMTAHGHWKPQLMSQQGSIPYASTHLRGYLSLHRFLYSKDVQVRWLPYKTTCSGAQVLLNPEEQSCPQVAMLFSLQFLSPGVFSLEKLIFTDCLCRCACLHFYF